jgi:hypothetical protein
MMNTPINGIAAIHRCVALAFLLLAALPRESQASELTTASGHICSGCSACNQPLVPPHTSLEHRCIDHSHRSGHPETQSKLAKPSLNKHYSFGYVGGGAAFHGEPRFSEEGTWGVDYSGILISKQTWLSWLHRHRSSRHDGSYQTDGPHLLQR